MLPLTIDFFKGANLILDFSALESATNQLEKALKYSTSDLAKDLNLFEQFRNSTVH